MIQHNRRETTILLLRISHIKIVARATYSSLFSFCLSVVCAGEWNGAANAPATWANIHSNVAWRRQIKILRARIHTTSEYSSRDKANNNKQQRQHHQHGKVGVWRIAWNAKQSTINIYKNKRCLSLNKSLLCTAKVCLCACVNFPGIFTFP